MSTVKYATIAALLATGCLSGLAQAQSLSKADQHFVHKAAMGGMAEVAAGQLASQRGSSDQVKQFGQMMVTDHTKANDQLKQIASSKGVVIPDSDPKADKETAKLSKLSGGQFDATYAKMERKDHAATIKLFQKEADKGQDPDLKKFAADTLPTLEAHDEAAKKLASSGSSQQ
jgi:putative membrane protein